MVLGMIVVGGEFGVEFNLFSLLTTHPPNVSRLWVGQKWRKKEKKKELLSEAET